MKTIIKLTGVLILLMGLASPLLATKYELDKKQSALNWTGEKVLGKHYGTIEFENGNLEVKDGTITQGSFRVNMKTIICKDLENEEYNKKLVGHLNSDDFFSTEKYPVSSLMVRQVKKLEGIKYRFEAELTIKGKALPISFNAEVEVNELVLLAKGKILVDRTLYDIKYGSGKFFSGLGDNMIKDDFILDFSLVAPVVPETVVGIKQ